MATLTEVGLPIKADLDQAWRDFAGWRVNYDEPLLRLCALVSAPSAPWSSDRVERFGTPRAIRLGRGGTLRHRLEWQPIDPTELDRRDGEEPVAQPSSSDTAGALRSTASSIWKY